MELDKQYIQDSRKERHKEHSEKIMRKKERKTCDSHNIHVCQIIWDRSD